MSNSLSFGLVMYKSDPCNIRWTSLDGKRVKLNIGVYYKDDLAVSGEAKYGKKLRAHLEQSLQRSAVSRCVAQLYRV